MDKHVLRIVKASKGHMIGMVVTGHKKMDWLRTSKCTPARRQAAAAASKKRRPISGASCYLLVIFAKDANIFKLAIE